MNTQDLTYKSFTTMNWCWPCVQRIFFSEVLSDQGYRRTQTCYISTVLPCVCVRFTQPQTESEIAARPDDCVCFQVMTVENSSTPSITQRERERDEGIKWIPGRREQRAGSSPTHATARRLRSPQDLSNLYLKRCSRS